MHKYNNFHSLLFENAGARQYYNDLPRNVRDQINAGSDNINSLGTLADYSERILKGDR